MTIFSFGVPRYDQDGELLNPVDEADLASGTAGEEVSEGPDYGGDNWESQYDLGAVSEEDMERSEAVFGDSAYEGEDWGEYDAMSEDPLW